MKNGKMEQPIYFPGQPQIIEQENQEYQALKNQNLSLVNALNSSNLGANVLNQNLVEFQLEAEEFKENLRHYIAGDEIAQKDDGQGGIITYYKVQTNEQLKTLNDLGVSIVMRVISGYVTKQTFLSVYSEERINEIIGELGQLLRVRIFSNAELVGLNTEFKLSDFGLLVFTILTFVENAYRRSIGGREREKIGESGIRIIQSQGLGQMGQMGQGMVQMPKKKFNLFNKNTW
jgi:hypothetical protein